MELQFKFQLQFEEQKNRQFQESQSVIACLLWLSDLCVSRLRIHTVLLHKQQPLTMVGPTVHRFR